MNNKQFSSILDKLGICTLFWAPECWDCVQSYDRISLECTNLIVEHECCETDICLYAQALMNLHFNRNPFKNRMEGEIKDDWICKERMGIIAKPCYELLCKIELEWGLEDWQVQLKNVFKDMM